MWLPSDIHKFVEVVKFVNNESCAHNGYYVVSGINSENMKRSSGTVTCWRYKPSTKSRSKGVASLSAGPKDKHEKCNFSVTFHLDKAMGRWFVKKNAGHDFTHNGHLPKLQRHQALGSHIVPKKNRDIVELLLETRCPTQIAVEYLNITTNLNLSAIAIKKLRRTVLLRKHQNDGESSTAEVLVKMLEERDDMHYVMYTGNYDEASRKVRVRKKNKNAKTPPSQEDIENLSEKAKANIKSIIDGLRLEDGEFLIGVAWVTEEGKHLHSLSPEVLGIDIKF